MYFLQFLCTVTLLRRAKIEAVFNNYDNFHCFVSLPAIVTFLKNRTLLHMFWPFTIYRPYSQSRIKEFGGPYLNFFCRFKK